MKKKYYIENMGCDDTTRFTMELTDNEYKIISKFIDENNDNSSYQCQPEIIISEIKEEK